MALSFTERTIRGKAQDTLLIDNTTDTIVISRNNLTGWDIDQLTKIEATIATDETVNNILEALQAYTMPNGMNAYTYYTPFLINIEEVATNWRPKGEAFTKQVWDRLDANDVTLADHETRITTLEP